MDLSLAQPKDVILYFVRMETGKKFQQSFYDDSDGQLLGEKNAAMPAAQNHELFMEFDKVGDIEGKQNPLL